MPNHFHILLPFESEISEIRHRKVLNGITGSLSQKLQIQGLWQPQNPPSEVSDFHHLRRTIRYVALNPCRKNLCQDPLEWPWSTYRELFGSTVDQWVNKSRIATTLGENEIGFENRFHTYVTSDPSVTVKGTATPKISPPRVLPQEGILEILDASAAALRTPASQIKKEGPLRNLFVHLACRQGWRKPTALGEICGITPRAVQLIISKAPPKGLEAAALCLGDRRLRELPNYLQQKSPPSYSSQKKK